MERRMVKHAFISGICLIVLAMSSLQGYAQEQLTPPRHHTSTPAKNATVLTLPFFEDFSQSYNTHILNPELWQGNSVFVNADYADYAPSIGMATLDAFDENGNLQGSSGDFFGGDTLCSRPIRLDSIFSPQARRLTVEDSVALSFYFAPGGGMGPAWSRCGDAPEEGDSLVLEFYNPVMARWELVWSTPGFSLQSLQDSLGIPWQWVFLMIESQDYFHDGFQFRFRNRCSLDNMTNPSLVSNSDQWNIDYIELNCNRSCMDSTTRDVAFIEKSQSFLKRYSAMPARQYRTSDMADSVVLRIINHYEETLSTSYTYSAYDAEGTLLNDNTAGHENVPSWHIDSTFQTTSRYLAATVNFSFPETDTPSTYRIEHIIKEGVSGDLHPANDTVIYLQSLQNYFAYDDGSAENGYGVTADNGQIRIAVQFHLATQDTLTAIDLYFNRVSNHANESAPFYLCIWENDNGKPGNLLYKDTQRRFPQFQGLNTYTRYVLESAVPTQGDIFVGLQQASLTYINLGFDRSRDASRYTCYQAGGPWQQSLLSGSLMIRPCFGHAAASAIASPAVLPVRIYPNPASSWIIFQSDTPRFNIYTAAGVFLFQCSSNQPVNIQHLPQGTYLASPVSSPRHTTPFTIQK